MNAQDKNRLKKVASVLFEDRSVTVDLTVIFRDFSSTIDYDDTDNHIYDVIGEDSKLYAVTTLYEAVKDACKFGLELRPVDTSKEIELFKYGLKIGTLVDRTADTVGQWQWADAILMDMESASMLHVKPEDEV